jgi:hypothetical protein
MSRRLPTGRPTNSPERRQRAHATALAKMLDQTFGHWLVLAFSHRTTGKQRRDYWFCRCLSCGREYVKIGAQIRAGQSLKCRKCVNVVHGHARPGQETRTYQSWRSMNDRCRNTADPFWRLYGARGIAVCERWKEDFVAFLADMGPRPAGTTLDRINGDKGYAPDNCRWATPAEQARNRRGGRINEEAVKVMHWAVSRGRTRDFLARLHGVTDSTVEDIIKGRSWRLDPLPSFSPTQRLVWIRCHNRLEPDGWDTTRRLVLHGAVGRTTICGLTVGGWRLGWMPHPRGPSCGLEEVTCLRCRKILATAEGLRQGRPSVPVTASTRIN